MESNPNQTQKVSYLWLTLRIDLNELKYNI